MQPPFCQLDSADAALRSHGCGIWSAAWIIDWSTDWKGIPSDRAGLDKEANRLLRLSGVSVADFNDRGTTLDEIERAVEAYRVPDYLPLAMKKLHGGSLRDAILPALKNGDAAWVAINYGVLQDAGKASPLSSFRGGHAVILLDSPTNGKVTVIDPLRRMVVDLPVALIEHAMETFGSNPWGNGRGEAGIVSMAQTYREAYDAATKKLKAANAQVADLKDSVALAEGKLRNALAEVKNAQVAARLAEQTASELRARLNTALARIKELEADPPDCAPLVDAARKEGRTTMQAEAVLAITALVP